MIFSSPKFILLFLPITFFCYFFLNKIRLVKAGKAWLVIVSLFFYSYWNIAYLPLLLTSILFNFTFGSLVSPSNKLSKHFSSKLLLIFSITANICLLGYFKYANFFIENLNNAFDTNYLIPEIILPLGISFFTFTQIAYLVDSYKGKAKEYDLINYSLFVTFFPHLIAGPILHHREMMDQFKSKWNLAIRYRNIYLGLFIFSIGLFKKTIIADTFASWANSGFDQNIYLDFFSAWATSLSYTFQLYFDFSGYCDMAVGASLLFNIWLPINFNSPYKALDIQDFWRRWHITLSRFLRDYLYIPLGGNRCSNSRIYFNLMITFVLGGLWHGASWMFILWGALHGLALVIHRVWKGAGLNLPTAIAWITTFSFINITWIFFRANSIQDALRVLRGMVDFSSINYFQLSHIPTANLAWGGVYIDYLMNILPIGLAANILCYLSLVFAFIITTQKNSYELMMDSKGNKKLIGVIFLFCIALYSTIISKSSVFLYFNF